MKTGFHPLTDNPDSIGYDHIMLLEDQPTSIRNESNIVKLVFLASCGFVALMGGFSLQLAMSSRRHRSALRTKVVQEGVAVEKELEDPVLFASRALGWGTLFAVLGTGSIGLTAVGIWKLFSTHKGEEPEITTTNT